MTYEEERIAWERQYWRALLFEYGGSVTEVAEAAEVNRTHLYRKLQKLSIISPKLPGNAEWRALEK